VFTYNREPPAEWQEALEALYPRNEEVSWLKVYWVSGEPSNPVQRWVIFQMTPRSKIPIAVLPLLQGPAPSKTYRPPMMREQWDLFRSTTCYAQPFWIIQGNHGGHKRRFSQVEQQMLKLHNQPTEPPIAGTLPYAPFDQRVLDKLAPLDQVRFYHRSIELENRSPEMLEEDSLNAVIAMRTEYWKWLETQVDRAIESTFTAQNNLVADKTDHAVKDTFDYEQAKEHFIHNPA
jgi:hypothetical protein